MEDRAAVIEPCTASDRKPARRILTLDGGGIRGLFALGILEEIETQLRQRTGRSDLVLADEFDFFAGTSTGAIIAACLAWGMPVSEIIALYKDHGRSMFHRERVWRRLRAFYRAESLARLFQKIFSESDGTPATLGSSRVRTMLLVVMRNASSGSAWPVSNNPCALFNDRTSPECNLDIPIWKLLRASTAAPVYFPPETITLGKQTHSFIDGGITPYNNPSLIAFLTATLPEYKIDWKPGEKNLLLVSVGTGLNRARFAPRGLIPSVLAQLAHLPPAMIHGAMQQQDVMCRILGKCVAGDALDMELGELRNDLRLMGEPMFRYARFNRQSKDSVKMDAVHRMQELLDSGRAFAKETVRVGDLFE